ncbi:MAG TPA: hypothetical protein VGP07_12555 [Polyangia bacterium]|jgi:hypothetical protein
MRKINRSEFLRSALAFAGVGVGIGVGLAGCSNDNGYGTTPVTTGGTTGTGVTNACDTNAPTDTIAANHGHVLTVTAADAAAGVDKTYDIMGTATHTHSVTITAAMFAMLETGASIASVSTVTNSHQHDITVICA